ncbi:MAG TPA: 50S ribosomal protein L30 [candidate division Zixibacteria bacterium]|nr:50S ribosomal protein L30 [candidate division Zixibacteria bacterium]
MKKVRVKQIKSAIGYSKDQKDTLRALRLGKLHREVVHNATPQIMGMIRKVRHLVEYEIIEEE